MSYQKNTRQRVPHIVNWRMAYAARELRHNKTVTISCLMGEADNILEQLNSFSNSGPIIMKTFAKPNSKEVLLEIADIV